MNIDLLFYSAIIKALKFMQKKIKHLSIIAGKYWVP